MNLNPLTWLKNRVYRKAREFAQVGFNERIDWIASEAKKSMTQEMLQVLCIGTYSNPQLVYEVVTENHHGMLNVYRPEIFKTFQEDEAAYLDDSFWAVLFDWVLFDLGSFD